MSETCAACAFWTKWRELAVWRESTRSASVGHCVVVVEHPVSGSRFIVTHEVRVQGLTGADFRCGYFQRRIGDNDE